MWVRQMVWESRSCSASALQTKLSLHYNALLRQREDDRGERRRGRSGERRASVDSQFSVPLSGTVVCRLNALTVRCR
ncbi:MAG: hypothetical protein ACKERG_00620 [Candidatus Hodgkinia cicadicola]